MPNQNNPTCPTWMALALILLAAPARGTDAPPPEWFARGLDLQTAGSAQVYACPLPEAVYQTSRRPDLEDIRVFDHAGRAVPFVVDRPDLAVVKPARSVPVNFYALYAPDVTDQGDLRVDIRANAAGSIVAVRRKPSGAPVDGTPIREYMIDLSSLSAPAQRLALSWAKNQPNVVNTVRLTYSDDLKEWFPLVAAASVMTLKHGGHQIDQNTIDVPSTKAKYVRLAGAGEANPPRIAAITAALPPVLAEPARHWLGTKEAARSKTEYAFLAQGFLPVDMVRVRLPRPNMVLHVEVQSRSDEDPLWVTHFTGLVTNVRLKDQPDSQEIPLTAISRNRLWRLRLVQAPEGWHGESVHLDLGFIPDQLTFLAQGERPYRLAFGSARAQPRTDEDKNLLPDLMAKAGGSMRRLPALPGPAVMLGGDAVLHPSPWPANWRQWLLWLILLGVVVFLAVMVYTLYREMNSGRAKAAR